MPAPTAAELVSRHPHAARVLHRYGIEFCCHGGDAALVDVCRDRGLDLEALLSEVEEEAPVAGGDWEQAPLPDLIAHILARHHRPLDAELPRLTALAEKVRNAHPEAGAVLDELQRTFAELVEEIHEHMPKEEQVLFPMILAGRGAMAGTPIAVMEQDHVRMGELLERMRGLTNDYTIPAGACRSWQALWQGLDALEADLHVHVHLEDHVLFPRGLRG